MEIISIDISGKFAHFRKFYANNTALSYFIPPRTTIMGMLAALLGMEKDSYYQAMASDKIRLGIRILCPLKKSFHRLNLLKILGSSDFRGRQGRVQTPFEIVSGSSMGKDDVKYRIYISFFEEGKDVFEELKNALKGQNFTYNLTMGTANFSANVVQFQLHEKEHISIETPTADYLTVHSAICTERVERIGFQKNQKLLVEEELIPVDFKENNNRELAKIRRVIYSINKEPMPVILKSDYFKIKGKEGIENITFIE